MRLFSVQAKAPGIQDSRGDSEGFYICNNCVLQDKNKEPL